MLGCILVALLLIFAVIAPPIGIPLLLVVVVVMLVVAVTRGGLAAGQSIFGGSSRRVESEPVRCATCLQPIGVDEPRIEHRGRVFHRSGCYPGG